jgi:putative cell wall-binding protein
MSYMNLQPQPIEVRQPRRRVLTLSGIAAALLLLSVLFVLATPGLAQARGVIYTSLRGVDRYDTALRISKAMYPTALPPGSGVVLAPGTTYQEALCAAPLAAAYGGPVLLTPTTILPSNVAAELVRLAPAYVICVGLPDLVVQRVEDAMGAGVTVSSIVGSDVYDLSYRVAKALGVKVGGLTGATAIITRGDMFPDAIGVSPLACARSWPILFTAGPSGALHPSAEAALAELGITSVIKVGTYASLPGWVTGLANLSGADRYHTNRNVAEWAELNAGLSFAHVGIATGNKFPDAVAAGPYLAQGGGILLLSPLEGPLPASIRAVLAANDGDIQRTSFIAMIRPVTSQVKTLLSDLVFDSSQAMTHVWEFANEIGPRKGGSPEEWEAAAYGAAHFESLGYVTRITEVAVPTGAISHNVIAVKPGLSPLTIVVGGHMDCKVSSTVRSPGGNDNASGSATVLELARALKDATIVPTVVFVLFGNEEGIGGTAYDHHFGSQSYVDHMTAAERANLVGMISLDMVGRGTVFTVRMMERGPRDLRDLMLAYARATNVDLVYMKDTSTDGYSDHEPFENDGFPVSWIEWRTDPNYHTANDTYYNCYPSLVQQTGALVLGFLNDLDNSDLLNLQRAVD